MDSFCSAVHSVLCTGIYSVDRELSAGCSGRKRVLLPDRLRRCGSKSDLSVVLFIFPTTLARPEVTGSGFCNDLVRFIYRMDAPVNLFPSIHCLESWCCIHAAFAMKKPPKWYRYATTVMALGVFASTLFVKQHVLVDVFGGIIVYEIGYYIAGKTITFLNKKKELQKE